MSNDNVEDYFVAQMLEHKEVAEATLNTTFPAFANVLALWGACLTSGAKLLFFGNGGSAADAQHLAAEFVVRFHADRRALPAIALTTDSSIITACTNDLGFEWVFARQLAALGRPGDVAVAISTSGRSRNVIVALQEARRLGIGTTGFTGRDGGEMIGSCDVLIRIPSDVTARIQELHLTLGHMLCGAIDRQFSADPGGTTS